MTKLLRGVVFSSSADEDYDGMAHVWVRDAETAYWFSLARAVDSDAIEVMVSDQLNHSGDDLSVTLTPSGFEARLSNAAANALDGHLGYVVAFHPENQDINSIAEAMKIIFRGKSGLLLNI